MLCFTEGLFVLHMKDLTRINLNYRPLSRLTMDVEVMSRLNKGNKYILCIKDEVTNHLISIPIHQPRSEEIGNAPNRNCNYKILGTILHNNGSR